VLFSAAEAAAGVRIISRYPTSEPTGHPTLAISVEKRGASAMARTYREVAIEEMLRTVDEAMHRVINWWGDLPPPMNEAIEQFRTQLGAAIDSVEFVKRALDREIHEPEHRLD
jgi:hypothetical protein